MPHLLATAPLSILILATPIYGAALTYTCDFVQGGSPMRLVYKLDTVTGQAFMEGNAGITSVMWTDGDRAVTFLEPLGSGAVQTTTIAATGQAVHSRHTIIGDSLNPSQITGTCRFQQ